MNKTLFSRRRWLKLSGGAALAASTVPFSSTRVRAAETVSAIDIGSRRELLVDRHLIERLDGVRLELHRPVRRGIVFRTDAPWEGNGSGFQSVFQDGDRFRMYYRGGNHPASRIYETEKNSWETLCLAESRDGIHWTRPELGIVEFRGSTRNNLFLNEDMVREIGGRPSLSAVFKDANPECPPRERYKIVIMGKKPRGLYLLVSADGIQFRLRSPKPFTTTGAFDSQNLMFWDSVHGVYREYHRDFDQGVRGIMTAASKDPGGVPGAEVAPVPGCVGAGPLHQPGPALLPGAPHLHGLSHALKRPGLVSVDDPAAQPGGAPISFGADPTFWHYRDRCGVHDEPRRPELQSLGRGIHSSRAVAKGHLGVRRQLRLLGHDRDEVAS